jgi:histone-lysine N-methyltransferase SETMAR
MDNATPHRSKLTNDRLTSFHFRATPHSPYTPDLAPSDFFLFGLIKHQLRGRKCERAEELLEAVTEITGAIPRP